MAKPAPATSMPVDAPIELSPGVVHREAAFFAQEQEGRGFLPYQVDGAADVGRANGARSDLTRPPRVSGETPFRNLRGGRR